MSHLNRKYIVAVLIVLLAVGGIAAGMFFFPSGESSESALPSLADDAPYVLVKLENPLLLQKGITSLLSLKSVFEKNDSADDAINIAVLLAAHLDIAEEMAILLPPKDISRFYMSFFPVSDKFDSFIANPSFPAFKATKWQTDKGEGWKLGVAFLNFAGDGGHAELYVLKTSLGGRDIVLIAENEQGIDRMLEAKKSSSARLKIKRYNPGKDYIQTRTPLKPLDGGETKQGITEFALASDKTSAHLQIYTDCYSLLSGGNVPKSGLKGDDLPILGDGNLAAVFACDIPYTCFATQPTSKDPIRSVLEYVKPLLGEEYTNDIRKIMESGRLSAVVTVSPVDEKHSTAYFVIESKAKAELDKFYSLISKIMTPSSLKGWDSAGFADESDVSVLAARRGDILLLGIGTMSSYQKEATVPDNIKSFAAPHDLMNFVATSALLNVAQKELGEMAKSELEDYGVDISGLSSSDIDINSVQFRVITPEKADYGIYWDEKKQ